jgi:hypothetical protein
MLVGSFVVVAPLIIFCDIFTTTFFLFMNAKGILSNLHYMNNVRGTILYVIKLHIKNII